MLRQYLVAESLRFSAALCPPGGSRGRKALVAGLDLGKTLVSCLDGVEQFQGPLVQVSGEEMSAQGLVGQLQFEPVRLQVELLDQRYKAVKNHLPHHRDATISVAHGRDTWLETSEGQGNLQVVAQMGDGVTLGRIARVAYCEHGIP